MDLENALLAAAGVITPTKADLVAVASEESVVGESDSVGVAREVVDEASWSGERFLGIDDPLVLVESGSKAW
jgi:hypothetical protein